MSLDELLTWFVDTEFHFRETSPYLLAGVRVVKLMGAWGQGRVGPGCVGPGRVV